MKIARALMIPALLLFPFVAAREIEKKIVALRHRALPVRLPDVTGLASNASAGALPAILLPGGVPEVAVEVAADGRLRVAGVRRVSFWRGVNLPADTGPMAIEVPIMDELLLRVTHGKGKPPFRIRKRQFADSESLRDILRGIGDLVARDDEWRCRIMIQGKPDVPFGLVAGAVVAALESGLPVLFQAPPAELDKGGKEWSRSLDLDAAPPPKPDPAELEARARAGHARARSGDSVGLKALKGYLKIEAAKHPWGEENPDLSNLGVRIRTDAHAEFRHVQRVLLACMEAGVWRVSFAARADGREVVLGRMTEGPESSIIYDIPDDDDFETVPLTEDAQVQSPVGL